MQEQAERTRTLSDYVSIVRRRLLVVLIVAAVTVGAAAAYTLHQPRLYQAQMKMFVGQSGALVPQFGNVADQFTATMSDLIESDEVANQVIRRTGVRLTPSALLSNLHVSTKPNVAVLDVSYVDTNPARATRILSATGQVFTTLVGERLGSSLANANQRVTAQVFDPAHAQTQPIQPKPVRNIALAIVLGALLGLLAALAAEQLDTTVRSVEGAERSFGQTATATIPPNVLGYRPFERVIGRGRDPVLAELAVQRLRGSLLWTSDTRRVRAVLVTSAGPEEGKTTIAANLAVALAKEGRNVIVVDTDLRRPRVHRYMTMRTGSETVGFDSIVRGEATIAQALVDVPLSIPPLRANDGSRAPEAGSEIGRGRLRAILAAPGRGWPADVRVERIHEVIEQLKAIADYVILDSPPVLAVSDAYAIAVAVDTVIAVVRVGKSTTRTAAGLATILRRLDARRVELIVTDTESQFGETYSYYHSMAASQGSSVRQTGAPAAAVASGAADGPAAANGSAGSAGTAGTAGPPAQAPRRPGVGGEAWTMRPRAR